jgi:hypothetical protein
MKNWFRRSKSSQRSGHAKQGSKRTKPRRGRGVRRIESPPDQWLNPEQNFITRYGDPFD